MELHRKTTHRPRYLRARAALTLLSLLISASWHVAHAADAQPTIGIVELQLSNPFFDKLEKSAVETATKHGWKVMTAEATVAGDSSTQIAAIENMINRGVKGITLDNANAYALVPIVRKARAAGIVVVTVNSSLNPMTAADASFETDNVTAGKLIGQWAKARIGTTAPHVAMLDYDLADRTANARHVGFLQGFGIADGSPQIAGTALTLGNVETGQVTMENLLSAHPDINILYTINEPTAQGASLAIKKAKRDIIVTSIDGSCSGVRSVASGQIGATVMQFPSKMGQLAVESIIQAAGGGKKPTGFNNTGTVLITDHPVPGLDSKDSKWGLANCWGG
ncbi:substrate-binding domain-containing protein [Paraburkholderia megapolitana]|uniref:Fructose transport system substrate-binding protein n=1 Tax=Paraburkholderia megapolitana TaxID=420953 RepID=A0A1I3GQB9_9BURK|nr:substrate-binding domain-containing protein [Paraburkholderia megapolitana]QDQ83006.1 sugar ABC transporter substrate-binding protein [Paraburkholderia megapolitana]SFI25640.1 fructose transport system substrate-binding protein [Paraburkholderia megapolitana]